MQDCIFCKIVKSELPSYKVYEDNDFLAFLDINPLSPGHCQIIPKEHCRWVWDYPEAGKYFEIVKKIALAEQKAFQTESILVKIDGQDVHHAHIWVYPHQSTPGDAKDFKQNLELLSQAMSQ
ncbi:MAG TPA: HIT domain-containing protein [Candidatus Paceibacterota bacterium]